MKQSSCSSAAFLAFLGVMMVSPSFAEIRVGVLTKEKAKEKYGITMHARKNGRLGNT